MKSKRMYICHIYLDKIAEAYNIHIIWKQGPSDIPVNYKAEELISEFSSETCKTVKNDNALVYFVNAASAHEGA